MDSTQFIRIAPGDLLPEDDLSLDAGVPLSAPVPALSASRRSLAIAVVLGLLAGAFLILVLASLSRARH